MNTITKADSFSPLFAANNNQLSVKPGSIYAGHALTENITLPEKLTAGRDYMIALEDARISASELDHAPDPGCLGGFHVGLDGQIVPQSIWDPQFRPSCADPRGMVFVPKVGWVDIYLLNVDPQIHGTSKSGVEIADGRSEIMMPDGNRRRLTWWVANHVLAQHGKQLLSREEFALAMDGVEDGKNNGTDPETTGHAEGLKSRYGIEQATGCMWTWSRDIEDLDGPWLYVMSGDWNSGSAGPRRLYYNNPDIDWGGIGARGRCDHLWPDLSEAKA